MTNSTCRIPNDEGQQCGARAPGVICGRHIAQIRDILAGSTTVQSIADLLAELDVTIARQDRGTGAPLYAMTRSKVQVPGVHYDEGDTALPSTQWAFSWDASNVRWTVENTLTTWARHIAERRDVEIPVRAKLTKTTPASTYVEIVRNRPRRIISQPATSSEYANPTYLADLTRWLMNNLDEIRTDPAAVELHDELRAAHRDALQAVDRQVPDEFLGRCTAMTLTTHWVQTAAGETLVPELAACGEDLNIRTGDDEVRCSRCGARFDAVTLRQKLDEQKPNALSTPGVIADALTTAETPLTRVTLNKWIGRDAQQSERDKEGPWCQNCEHRTCDGLRKAEIQRIVKRQGRPMIYRQGWDAEGRSVYRAGDVQARLAWNATIRGERMQA